MLRRIISQVFEEIAGVPRQSMPPLPRPRGESLRDVGDRRRRPPEPAAANRDEARRERAAPVPTATPGAQLVAGLDLVGALHSPAEVRRAFVLMEVLGPPVSLRDRSANPHQS
jgi:hypothetical protein